MVQLPGAELGKQMLLQLAVGVGARLEADRRPFANGVHQRSRLLGRQPPVADQLPLEPFAHHADELLDHLEGKLGPADDARVDLIVSAVVLDHPLHRALRDARTDIVDQTRHHLGIA